MEAPTINKILKPAVEEKTLHHISTTSLKCFYFSRMNDIVFDDEHEVLKWRSIDDGMNYYADYTDINMIVCKDTPDQEIPRYY
ncbi:hypothetical protein Bp8pS_072 [Bacillus phage vB_BpuM-BpSp]|nr:hypothetical protein Bp8pS_072 [Bacillus phage vB_BpuM-BpSp]